MATSVSIIHPSHPMHHSKSFDDQDQYYDTTNDDAICMGYLNGLPPTHKSHSKDGMYRPQIDHQMALARTSSATTKPTMSPYLQKLPHSNFIQTILPPSASSTTQQQRRQRRRRSTSIARTRGELLDTAYQPSNIDHLDLSSFLGNNNRSANRPTSAPTRTMIASAHKKRTRISHHKSSSKSQTFIIKIYRNGDHEINCLCKATALNAILQYATEKLHMSSAARRLFDINGQEIYREEDIQSNQEYFASSGENFKNPYKSIKMQTEYGLNSTWTMNGLQTDTTKPKSFTTTVTISERLQSQIKTSINLTIFENGFGHDTVGYHLLIDAALKDNLEKFLDYCTQRIQLTGHAKRAFTFRGDPIRSLKLFLESDDCKMQTANGEIIYGPVWLSKGEKYRPTGAYIFLETRYKECQTHLKILQKEYNEVMIVIKKRKRQTMIDHETDDDAHVSTNEGTDKEDDKVIDVSTIQNKGLLSMKKKELKEARKTLEIKIQELKDLMALYRSKMDEIEDAMKDEDSSIAQHIKQIDFDDRIVGRHPLCLIIHENGSYHSTDPVIYLNLRSLPSKKVPQTSIEYLLDYLQTSLEKYARQRPKRVFDINGIEIKLLGQIRSKQHLFISYGEDYRPAFEPCLAIELHGAEVYEKDDGLSVIKAPRTEDQLLTENEKKSIRQVAASWKVAEKIPDDVHKIKYADLSDEQVKQAVDLKIINDRIYENVTFITKNHRLIYPELRISQRIISDTKSKPAHHKAPPKKIFSDIDLQTWCYTKDGYIYNKQLNSLVLTVIPEQDIQITWKPSKLSKQRNEQNLNGYGVQLRDKATELSHNQIWIFTTDGYIISKAYPDFALTSAANIIPGEDENFIANGIKMKEDNPFISFVALCPKCPANSPFIHRQRWGIRQISGFTIGDWKYSKVENPVWHKMALTWPVDSRGAMIPDLQWPIEGCFIPGVPPIKSLKSSQAPDGFVPIRLQVLRNGERDMSKAVFVVGPDISNFILETKGSARIFRRLHLPEPEKDQRVNRQLKRMADARQREIKIFLENCTNLCNLPFAGRRLFDEHGTELFDLSLIERDSIVYVTCGESWIDPELTKAEQQRRLLLAYLSNDVRMIYFYCALRNPIEYAVSTENGLSENSQLILSRCALNAKQRARVKQGESIEHVIENEGPIEETPTDIEPRTAHERAHKNMDRKSREEFHYPWEKSGNSDKKSKDAFPWPWEKIANKSLNLDTDDDDVIMPSTNVPPPDNSMTRSTETLNLSKQPRKLPRSVAISMQKFRWEPTGGYISCMDDSNLVFGVKEIESKVVDVILKRRNADDIFQRWVFISLNDEDQNEIDVDFTKPFLIVSKARPTMALTVLLPSCTGNESSDVNISCIGCPITLQPRRYEENGCANQKWAYDETLGFLLPFNATLTDKEITAANRANICSYTVNYEALSQPGFIVSILNNNDQSEDVPVCLACAQAMRGKYRLVKIEPDKKFTCVIGKRLDLKFHGPFHCLNHKVDLTRDEAENTLFQRQEQLEQLRQEASVRNIAKELAAAKPIQIVHLLAYRNGEGHTRQGKLLIGSSIIGLLDQATHRLDLTNAARRFYVIDGNVMLSIEDLIQWATEYYKKRFNQISKPTQTQLLDRVDLDTPVPPKIPDSQRRSSLDNQSEKTTLSSKLRDLSPTKQHFQGLPKASDLKRAIKQNSVTRAIDVDMSYLLKFPIEVWVSSGEAFVRPSDADQKQNQRFMQREERTPVVHELEREKHALRLLKGRRISGQSTGELVPQQNPDVPVIKQGHWTQKSDAELDKQDDVELLRNSLGEILVSQQPEITRPISSAATDRLAQHSKIKRTLIYLNGEPKETAVQCFGSNLNELMEAAKMKLNLMQPIQALFDENGHIIERFDQLNRDQLVCVSTTKTFISFSEKQREVDVKADWARTRNKYGDQATDIRVSSNLSTFPHAADPFGPPILTSDDQNQLRPTTTITKPPPAPAPLYRRLAIEQQQPPPKSATLTEITPSPTVMKDSLMLSDDDDDGPDSEIERITNVNNDENESSRTTTAASRNGAQAKSPFSQLFPANSRSLAPTRPPPSTQKSDSDDDEFIKMLKRK
ncbi:unnamed protein product [Adineta steineri]|uniref:Doublecortin domain-containing protein n=2 Tax=Adineta steineri TaxID=433720 RepID=A0A819MRG6_9BILA|nr:unnamed protein product [Adineta steineri]